MVQSPPLEPGLSRRGFLGGGAALVLGGCAGIRGRGREELDPRAEGVLAGAAETAKLIGGNYVRVFRQVAAARKEAA